MREADSQQRIHYIGKPRALIALSPKQHGWERFGRITRARASRRTWKAHG